MGNSPALKPKASAGLVLLAWVRAQQGLPKAPLQNPRSYLALEIKPDADGAYSRVWRVSGTSRGALQLGMHLTTIKQFLGSQIPRLQCSQSAQAGMHSPHPRRATPETARLGKPTTAQLVQYLRTVKQTQNRGARA